MIIIAEIQGWRRRLDIADHVVRSGQVRVAIHKPLTAMVAEKAMIPCCDEMSTAVDLYYDGKENGIPVFKYV